MTTKHHQLLQPNGQKGTTLIAGNYHASLNRQKQTAKSKPNSVKVRIFQGDTIDDIF